MIKKSEVVRVEAWVVGGTSGIGAAIVEGLQERGIQPLVISNDARVGQQLGQKGIVFECMDLSASGVEIAQQTISLLGQYGLPTYLFMSAGLTREQAATETSPEDWLTLANVNLLSVAQMCNVVTKAWLNERDFEAWRRHVVILGSVNAMRPLSSQGAYSVMKAGLHAYAKCLSNDVAGGKIRVNVVAPGAIWTPMNESLFLNDIDGSEKRRVIESSLIERWGHAREIGDVALWVALDSPEFLTGSELVVDGGHVVKR